MNRTLVKAGFKRSESDPCLYTRCKDRRRVIILCHTDDFLLVCESPDDCKEVTDCLNKEIKVKRLRSVSPYLGTHIQRDASRNFYLDQENKTRDLVRSLEMEDDPPKYTPMELNYVKQKKDTKLLPGNNKYCEILGKIVCTSN